MLSEIGRRTEERGMGGGGGGGGGGERREGGLTLFMSRIDTPSKSKSYVTMVYARMPRNFFFHVIPSKEHMLKNRL